MECLSVATGKTSRAPECKDFNFARDRYGSNMLAIFGVSFAWDPKKNRANILKHGVTFEEASTVFSDAYARIIADPDHSDDEERFVILGMSRKGRMLIVCHCYREKGNVIRIISAREATKTEGKTYWRYCHES